MGFCLRNGYDVGKLETYNRWIDQHRREADEMREAIRNESFPVSEGWDPGTTVEDAKAGLKDLEEFQAETVKKKAEFWNEYQDNALHPMTEGEALEEVISYQRMEDEWFKD